MGQKRNKRETFPNVTEQPKFLYPVSPSFQQLSGFLGLHLSVQGLFVFLRKFSSFCHTKNLAPHLLALFSRFSVLPVLCACCLVWPLLQGSQQLLPAAPEKLNFPSFEHASWATSISLCLRSIYLTLKFFLYEYHIEIYGII